MVLLVTASSWMLPLLLKALVLPLLVECWSPHASGLRRGRLTMNVYPASTRQALLEKAKSLDPSIASQGWGSYSTRGWSNRLGTVLTPASIPGVYTADRPFNWNNIDVGCRMTVVELAPSASSGAKPDLWVHSPVGLDGPLKQALEQLGTVQHIVSPNYEHLKYVNQWAEAYPDAKLWGCPGLVERKPELNWAGEIPSACRPPSWPEKTVLDVPEGFWDWNEIQPLHIDCEVNPLTGKPFFNEVIYFHVPSKTLMTTDLYWNYPKGDGVTNSNYKDVPGSQDEDFGVWELAPQLDQVPWGSKLWKQGMDKVFRPFYLNLMVQKDKRSRFRAIAEFLVEGGWDVETVIPAHGDIIRGRKFIQTVLHEFFAL